jgi:hypothetical protein
VKLGVASDLDRLSARCPEVRYAVVFDSTLWRPSQPPEGSRWDYELFTTERLAREALADVRPGESDLELWERRNDGWQQVA